MSETRKTYKRPKTKRLPNLTYQVELTGEDGALVSIDVETIHPWRYEFEALPDLLVGRVEVGLADPSGLALVAQARLYMRQLLVGIDGLDPAELADAGGDVKAVLDLPGNEELAFMLWSGFLRARAGAYTKSGSQDAGARDREGDGAAAAAAGGDAPLPGV